MLAADQGDLQQQGEPAGGHDGGFNMEQCNPDQMQESDDVLQFKSMQGSQLQSRSPVEEAPEAEPLRGRIPTSCPKSRLSPMTARENQVSQGFLGWRYLRCVTRTPATQAPPQCIEMSLTLFTHML